MNPLENIKGVHRLVTLELPGRAPARMLCLVQQDANGDSAYYVLAECEGKALKWRSMIRENSIHRLKSEFLNNITSEVDLDTLDVETIFLCTTEVTKA